MSRPGLISVVVPVLNGEAHLAQQLEALAEQTYGGEWELVLVDNGCSDRSLEVARAYAARLPSLRIVDARSKRGLNHARNAGALAAAGDFLTFCDADDVVSAGWLEAMAAAAEGSDLVGGRLEWEALNDPCVRAWRPQEPMRDLLSDHGFLRYAPGGNLGVWTAIAREIRWDERFIYGSSDQGFAWRAQLAGYRLAFAPEALIQQRFRPTIPELARQQLRYGMSGPRLQRACLDLGLPPPDNRHALRIWHRLLRTAPDLVRSRELRGRWVASAAFRLGRIAGSLRERTVCL